MKIGICQTLEDGISNDTFENVITLSIFNSKTSLNIETSYKYAVVIEYQKKIV